MSKLDGLARLAAAASPAPTEQGLHGLSALARLADLGPASARPRLAACPAYLFQPTQPVEGPPIDPFSYDIIIVAFSGGADSLAMVLLLLLLGVPKDRIELWHHDIDGREGSTLMDWPCTRDYCRKVADALGLTLYFSWKQYGFEGEMLRDRTPTAGYLFEGPNGLQRSGGESEKEGYRRRFPAPVGDLGKRWCSAYGKIMVMDTALRNQPRFTGKRTLVLTGERADESPKRAKYKVFQPHRASSRTRHIDVWRPVHRWTKGEVWALIERYRVAVHPGYRLGWGRLSCAACIFGSPDQWASLRVVNPPQFRRIGAYERELHYTINMKGKTVLQMADEGRPIPNMREEDIRAALSRTFDEPIFVAHWTLPAGAHGDACGPT